MEVVRRHFGTSVSLTKLNIALAATLVHDVGHGMFSHAFEEIGEALKLPMARHEMVSEALIRNGEIADILHELGSGFENDVADLVRPGSPRHLYHSVVSSQFDADRLDYMQRDRMMTGVQSSGIDFTWLMENLEVAKVPTGTDEVTLGDVETLVLGSKAFHAAEGYVLALFQLYPNVYFHKATRAAEKLFAVLMMRIIKTIRDGNSETTGLPKNHPIVRFALAPDKLERALDLDDCVFWGALPMLADATDNFIQYWAGRLGGRKLPKCIDIRKYVEHEKKLKPSQASDPTTDAEIRLICQRIADSLRVAAGRRTVPEELILVDQTKRTPYKKGEGNNNPLDQILIRQAGGTIRDMAEISKIVASAETYEVCRCYIWDDDTTGRDVVENIMRTEIKGKANADA